MNEELKPGDWVRLVNLDDTDLNEYVEYELGKVYQVKDVWYQGTISANISVIGIYHRDDPDDDWPIFNRCFEKEHPFLTRFKEIIDEQ